MCDLCGEVLDGDNFGQTTADTILCAVCMESILRRREDNVQPTVIVENNYAE